ncbi:MAG TPA: hypothetical protein VGN79_01870 [Devosia sp.]|jgi:hypothetical protein|nr:hypothetical protein [Devosia sp.]
MAIAETIFSTVFRGMFDTITRQDVQVNNQHTDRVAAEITKQVSPVVVNATNSEPWFRSRIFIGVGVAAVSFITSRFLGFAVDETDFTDLTHILLMLIEAWGLFYAWYGRKVGASKKPLGQ